MRINFNSEAIVQFYSLRRRNQLAKVSQGIKVADSTDEAIRVALQFGAIHTLGARAAQMYWISQTPITAVKTLAVYKWLRLPVIQRLEQTDDVRRICFTKGDKTLVDLNPDSSEITRFAKTTPLDETEEMQQVISSMQALIVMNPQKRSHLKDKKPFVLIPVRVDQEKHAVFKIKFEKKVTRSQIKEKLPQLKEIFSALSKRLIQIEKLMGRSADNLALRIEKETLVSTPQVGMSILAGPFRETTRPKDLNPIVSRLRRAQKHGVDLTHLDIMDGRFNEGAQLIGPVASKTDPEQHLNMLRRFLAYLRPRTQLPIDVHLMVQEPTRYIVELMKVGVDLITISAEMNANETQPRSDLADLLMFLRKHDVHAGLATNPDTPLVRILPFTGFVDIVTLMSVVPGASGQSFRWEVISKITDLKRFNRGAKLNIGIEVDGGINQQTAKATRAAGANIMVAASALYRKSNLSQIVARMKE